jgi:hypothetical protein
VSSRSRDRVKPELVAIFRVFAVGTSVAFAIYVLAPAMKRSKDFFQPYFVSQLTGAAKTELVVIFSLILVSLFLTGIPSRILRSLKVGLIPIRHWIWAPSAVIFWVALEHGQLKLAWGTLSMAMLLAVVAQLIPRISVAASVAGPGANDPDLPLPENGQDLLGRERLVNELIARIVLDQPPVIAVTGEYGDGKTSLLNLTVGELKRTQGEKAPIIVRFSPWLATDSNTLVLSLLESVIAEIRTELLIPGIGRDAARYARTLLGAVPRLDRLKEMFAERSQAERIGALANHISKTQRRVLVVLDDLDRMQPNELETVFKILRGTDKLSNVTFICAFDPAELQGILKASRPNQDPAKFLEKFFPTEVRIPRADPAEFQAIVSKRLSALVAYYDPSLSGDADKRFEELWDDGADRYLTNLRRVKLFINRLGQSLQQIAGEVNVFDFITLELIREVKPMLYEEIYRQRGDFWDRDLAFEIAYKGPFVADEKMAREERAKYYDTLKGSIDSSQRFVLDLLARLFPKFAEYHHGRRGTTKSMASSEAEKSRHIFHPRCFRQYFSLSVPTELFSQSEFSAFRSAIRARHEGQVAKAFSDQFQTLFNQEFKRWHFMHVIASNWEGFGMTEARGLCRGMARSSLPWVLDAFELGDAVDVTGATLLQIKEGEERRTFLHEVVRESASPVYRFLLLNRLEEKLNDPSGIPAGWRFRAAGFGNSRTPASSEVLSDIAEAKLMLKVQMRESYIVPNAPSIFQQLESLGPRRIEPIVVLFEWQKLGEDAASDQQTYLIDLFERRPEDLKAFLPLMFRVEFIDDYTTLKALIDYRKLSELIDKNEDILDAQKVAQFRKRFASDAQTDVKLKNGILSAAAEPA